MAGQTETAVYADRSPASGAMPLVKLFPDEDFKTVGFYADQVLQ